MKDITKEFLEDIVPERIFWRGEDLYNEGAVENINISKEQITAKVLGTRLYTVKAEIQENDFLFSCTCPYEGFCKHRIALGLWMVENKRRWSNLKEVQVDDIPNPDVNVLLKKATPEQKDKFLIEALSESSMLLNRFEVMIKGAANLGGDIDVDRLANEIKVKMEAFDLEDYTRFYDSSPERYGYREEWEILQDGAEAEFDEIFDQNRNSVLGLLEIHNVISSFKYLLAVYEAVKIVDFETIDDPVNIFEGDGLYYLADLNLDKILDEFIYGFKGLSFDENIYIQLIDVLFRRISKNLKKQLYQICHFTELLQHCVKTENIAVYLSGLLRKNSSLPEEEYSEILLAVYEKVDDKKRWLDTAEKYYKTNRAVAEKLLNHFVNDKGKLVQLARDIAFCFNDEFVPFFYENLKKKDDSELYKKILVEHAKKLQTVELYQELKKDYGMDAAWKFINDLEEDWSAEKFYIRLLQEEKAFEKLLTLAQKKSKTSPAMQYLRPIVNVYPDQVFKIISTQAERFLEENTGRNYYRQAAEWLKLLKKIKDKKLSEKSEFFISHLLGKFSNRRAMKDEFSKVGLC